MLRVRDVPRPSAGRGEVLVRVRAAALNPKDVLVRCGKFRLLSGRRFPKGVGFDWAGEVEVFALDRIVEAEAAVATKHTRGKIVVRIG